MADSRSSALYFLGFLLLGIAVGLVWLFCGMLRLLARGFKFVHPPVAAHLTGLETRIWASLKS
jgi:hypothetical protein